MGYTHYWKCKEPNKIPEQIYRLAFKECETIIENVKQGLLYVRYNKENNIDINGIAELSHENFCIPYDKQHLKDFDFCKTQHKPYDKVVTACLSVLYKWLSPYSFIINSDGNVKDWNDGIQLANSVLKSNYSEISFGGG